MLSLSELQGWVRTFHYTRFVFPLECHEWPAGAHLPLFRAVVHEAASAVSAALVASQVFRLSSVTWTMRLSENE